MYLYFRILQGEFVKFFDKIFLLRVIYYYVKNIPSNVQIKKYFPLIKLCFNAIHPQLLIYPLDNLTNFSSTHV